jgi:peptidyl-prolyl cis-trans isomerase SurA
MKKHFSLLAFFFFSLCVAFAQSPKVVADKILAIVGDKIILKSDIDNTISDMQRQGVEIPPNAKCMALGQAMGVKALVLQGERDSLPVSDDDVDADIDNQIRYFISVYGSKEELEKIAGKTIYQMKEDFRQGFRERKIASAMRNKIVEDVRITPVEVEAYFNKIPKDSLPFFESQVEVGEIVIYPKASQEANDYAIDQLKGFKKQIEDGTRKFGTLASLYSDDPGSKDKGGEYEVSRGEKQWDATFLAKAFSLKEGQVSAPFKTKFGYHIVQMETRNGDDATIRHILIIPQITQTEVNTANKKMDSIRALLIAGTLPFSEAVRLYSDDETSKFTGGRVQGKDGNTLVTIDQLDKDIVVKLKDLKVGEYSQPTEFTDDRGKKGIRILILINKTEPHKENMQDDYSTIAAKALEQKKNDILDNWFSINMPAYYIKVDEEYKDCDEIKKWTSPQAVKK